MRLNRKKLAILYTILSVYFFHFATVQYIIAIQLSQLGIIDVPSLVFGTITVAGFLICMYLAIKLLETKIMKETYFFVLFVSAFSLFSYSILNLVLRISFPPQWLITFSIIVGTPLSGLFAGYSRRTFQSRLQKLGWNQGITLVTLFVLVSLPIIEVLPSVLTWEIRSEGRIIGTVFESGNDTARVKGQIVASVFTAEVPIPSDVIFVAEEVVNVVNQFSTSLDLKIYLEGISGNLSRVEQVKISFKIENGSEICLLSIDNGNLRYEEVYLCTKSHGTVTMGITSSAKNMSTVMSLLMKRNDNHNLGMNISIMSVH